MHFALNFAPCFAWCEIWLEVCENGTRVPGVDFALCENFRTLNSGVRKWAWGVQNLHTCARRGFRTFHSGVRNWILGNSHLKNGFRTLKLISHLEVGVCEIFFLWSKDFAPWNWVCEIFAPWNQVCEILAPWNQVLCFLGFTPLFCFWRALLTFHDFFSEIYHQN